MKNKKYKTITVTLGLIALMLFCILAIVALTGLFKPNGVYAKIMGILIIAAGACLSLNAATTILDRPKDKVPSMYRKLALSIVIATGVLVVFWLIVLFVSDMGAIVNAIGGKKFNASSYEGSMEAAQAAANAAKNKVGAHLAITQIAICLTVIVAYFNLFVTRRFVFKNRMVPIQITLFIGAFLFYFWIFCFAASAKIAVTENIAKSRYSLDIRSAVNLVVNPLGFTIALSGLTMYIISLFASIGSMRRFKNEGLFEEKATAEVTSSTNDTKIENKNEDANTDDVKTRIQKLKELHDQGLISDEEYEAKKTEIIDSI